MRNFLKISGFILIIIGTLGLIISEFVFEHSSTRTLAFAAVEVIGLACLIYGRFWVQDEAIS